MAVLNSGLGGPEGFGTNVFSTDPDRTGNLDDGSVEVDITSAFGPDGIDYFGTNYTSIYINSNGLITFAGPQTAFTPIAIDSYGEPAIAPFWSDVDINKGGEIYWDVNPTSGAVTITWSEVAPFDLTGTPPLNSFQVVLTNTGNGDFSVEFIYEDIEWTNGYTGEATVGFTDGGTNDVVLPGSGDAAALTNFDTADFGNGDPDGTWQTDVKDGVILSSNGIVDGTAGDDIIDVSYDGDPENDFVDAADGTGIGRNDDIIDAGAGNDTVDGGLGDDTIYGNSGDDVLFGGDGDDTIFGDTAGPRVTDPFDVQYFELPPGGGGIDSLAEAGFDTIGNNSNTPTAEFLRDSLDVNTISNENGGNGQTYAVRFETTLNVTTDGNYAFTTTSDDGSQLFVDGVLVVNNDGRHSEATESGSTTLGAGEHNVVIIFFENTGSDSLSSTISGPDTGNVPIDFTTADIFGVVAGLPGNDTIDGGDGDDIIFGGDGDDIITVGAGDTAEGGADSDTFTLDFSQTSSSSATTITVDGGTDGVDIDSLDLTGFGRFTLTETTDLDGDSTSGTAIYDSGQTVEFTEIENLTVCFAKGTQIKAEDGIRAIETLRVGDKLATRDHGLQTIRWIGERVLATEELTAFPKLQPIRIAAGTLGDGIPTRDLIVSPQHRIVVRSRIAMRMFDAQEVFVPAKHLLGLEGVTIATDMTAVTYYHLLCDDHEIVEADGAFAETLYTGTEAMKAMTPEALEEIALVFGDQPLTNRPLALFAPKGQQAKKLVERHIKNDRAMYC